MRVRFLKMVATSRGGFNPGETADVPKKLGEAWCKAGLALPDGKAESKETDVEKAAADVEAKALAEKAAAEKAAETGEKS